VIEFRLQPKQSLAFQSRATEILYGGAAGGGWDRSGRRGRLVFRLKEIMLR
jgi:hypothetical protein